MIFMKKIVGLIYLMFVLVSCVENKTVEDEKLVDTNVDIKVEEKSTETKEEEIIEQKNNVKNKNFIDKTKYSKTDKIAISLINKYIDSNLVNDTKFWEIEIIKTYNYFEPKGNINLTNVVYAKDNENYYYFCSAWPNCEFDFKKYNISNWKIEIIDKFNYKIWDKEYLNERIEWFRKMDNERLKNQIIIKDFWNWLVLKQDTKWFMYDELWSTILYLNWKELIWLANNLTTIFCEPSWPFNLCRNEQITDKLIREKTANKFEILESNKDIKIDKDSNIKILYIWQYEAKDIYFIDLKNERIIKDKSWMDFFVNDIRQWKSWTFIMWKWWRWCWGGLFFINNNSEKKDLFKNNCDVDLNNIPEDYQEIIDFELILNKQVKIFYKWQDLEKKEKIINL